MDMIQERDAAQLQMRQRQLGVEGRSRADGRSLRDVSSRDSC